MIRKNWNYILLYSLTIASLITIWYLFFECGIVKGTDKILAALLPSLALTFGIFQTILSQINQKRRKLFDLRYEEFKSQIALISKISELINNGMSSETTVNAHGLVAQLLTLINEFLNFNRFQNEFLFKNIKEKEETKELKLVIEKILHRTDTFRKQIDDAKKKSELNDFAIGVHHMNWHNDVRELLGELFERRDGYFNQLKTFLN
jgi:hypothetical protein